MTAWIAVDRRNAAAFALALVLVCIGAAALAWVMNSDDAGHGEGE